MTTLYWFVNVLNSTTNNVSERSFYQGSEKIPNQDASVPTLFHKVQNDIDWGDICQTTLAM